MNFYELHAQIEADQNEGLGNRLSSFGHGRPQSYSSNPQINASKTKFISDNAGTFQKEQPIVQWVQSIPDENWPFANCLVQQWGLNYLQDITNYLKGGGKQLSSFAMQCRHLAPQAKTA